MIRRALAYLALGALVGIAPTWGASCGESSTTSVQAGSVCRTDDACPDGLVCRYGFCSARDGGLDDLEFQISPPESGAYVRQRVSDVSVGGESSPDFALGRPRRVRGTIAIGDEDGVGPTGRLLFRPEERNGSVSTRAVDVYNGEFDTLVLPGWYDVTFDPDSAEDVPKVTWPNQELTGDTQLVRTIPSSSELVRLDGSIEFEGRVFSTARVVAATADERFETTVDVLRSSSARRSFSLGALPRTASYDLLVRGAFTAGPENHEVQLRIDDWVDVDREDVESGGVPRGPAEIVGLEQGLVPGTVRLRAPDDREGSVDWSATKLVFRTSFDRLATAQGDSNVEGGLSWSVTLGEARNDDVPDPSEGVLRPNLVPAAYEVWVVPPSNSGLAARKVDFDVRDPGGNRLTVELEAKRRIVGRVVDAQGNPVEGARVDFHRQNRASGDPRPIQTGKPTRTDADGRFATRVAPVAQTASVQPKPNSGHPVGIETLSADRPRREEPLEIRLASPYSVRGSVYGRTADGGAEPLGGAEVDIFRTVGDRKFLLHSSSTRGDGQFFALLPASF